MSALLSFEGRHINREAVLYIGSDQPLIGFLDFLHRNHFHVGRAIVFTAEIEHLLSLGDAADGRAGEAAAGCDQAEGQNRKRFWG